MGELILCRQALAKVPYEIKAASLWVYSLEELGYYVEHNLYLLGSDFKGEPLCNWVDTELGLGGTAEKLRDILARNGSLSEYIACLFAETGYFSAAELKRLAAEIGVMEHKSEYERTKARADRYMENGRYAKAMMEYRKLLQQKNQENPLLHGNIWHNLGTASARLFLFQEAYVCYRKAYELNHNPESLKQCLSVCQCMEDEKLFLETATKCHVSPEQQAEFVSQWTEYMNTEETKKLLEEIEFTAFNKMEQKELIRIWKMRYRKNCSL